MNFFLIVARPCASISTVIMMCQPQVPLAAPPCVYQTTPYFSHRQREVPIVIALETFFVLLLAHRGHTSSSRSRSTELPIYSRGTCPDPIPSRRPPLASRPQRDDCRVPPPRRASGSSTTAPPFRHTRRHLAGDRDRPGSDVDTRAYTSSKYLVKRPMVASSGTKLFCRRPGQTPAQPRPVLRSSGLKIDRTTCTRRLGVDRIRPRRPPDRSLLRARGLAPRRAPAGASPRRTVIDRQALIRQSSSSTSHSSRVRRPASMRVRLVVHARTSVFRTGNSGLASLWVTPRLHVWRAASLLTGIRRMTFAKPQPTTWTIIVLITRINHPAPLSGVFICHTRCSWSNRPPPCGCWLIAIPSRH